MEDYIVKRERIHAMSEAQAPEILAYFKEKLRDMSFESGEVSPDCWLSISVSWCGRYATVFWKSACGELYCLRLEMFRGYQDDRGLWYYGETEEGRRTPDDLFDEWLCDLDCGIQIPCEICAAYLSA